MRILPFDGAPSAHLPSNSPSLVGELTAVAGELALAKASTGSVSLSNLARAVAQALTQGLPADMSLQLDDVLTSEDRSLLDWMSELTKAGGVDASQVRKLVVDLVAYRRSELALREPAAFPIEGQAVQAGAPQLASAPAAALPSRWLSLPTLTPEDETLARGILTSLAGRDTLVDRGFVHALIDPDRTPSPSVGLAFLARLVGDLSRARAGAAVDLAPSFARRTARVSLAQAVASLALPRDELEGVARDSATLGRSLLRQRLLQFAASPELSAEKPAADLPLAERAEKTPRRWSMFVLLTRNDRTLLSTLYASARVRGGDLRAVDDVARALIGLRESERAEAQQPLDSPEPVGVIMPELSRQLDVAPRSLLRSIAPASFEQAMDELAEQSVRPEPAADPFASWMPRSFGSATQIAAKLVGSYGSLVPQSERYRAAPSSRAPAASSLAGLAQLAHAQGAAVHLPLLGPPLNVVQALGLSGLLAELHTQLLRAPRKRRRDRKLRRGEKKVGPARDAELDELSFESPLRPKARSDRKPRGGVRWELLARRRRARSVLQT